jgi:L-methionine (R)-S-oxide reductase
MTDIQLTQEMIALLSHIRELASAVTSLQSLQENIVETIAQRLSYYSWTGFYMLDPNDPETLVLGPFVGDPTPHVRIPVTQGICGAAVASGRTVIVDDVNADPRYLACSIKTKSEIVVPIHAHGKTSVKSILTAIKQPPSRSLTGCFLRKFPASLAHILKITARP